MKLDPIYNQRPDDPNFIDCIDTPLDDKSATYYLNQAWFELFKEYPSINTLAILWAQCKLETGWTKLRNNNWGNIKKSIISPHYTSYDAGEYLAEGYKLFHPYHKQSMFSAWLTPLEGAKGYLQFLSERKRYQAAWQEVLKGNTVEYVKALRVGGYFTAPLDAYTKVVVKLTNQFKTNSESLLVWKPKEEIKEEPKVGVWNKLNEKASNLINKIFGK